MSTHPEPGAFRRRLLAGEPLLGTFIKTPSVHTTEIIGSVGFDFVVIDQEHAPFDRVSTDQLLLAARAWGLAALVRVPAGTPELVLAALDDGAAGVVVPHVSSGEKAKAAVAAARYRGGRRGFSNSPRAGGYGAAGIWQHVEAADAATAVIAMVEDPEAIDRADEIAAVEGLDAVFIGRGDLTVALAAESPEAPPVRAAVERIAAAARAHGKPVCAHAGRLEPGEVAWLRSLGVSAFIVSSDQGLLRGAATGTLAQFRQLTRPG